jgi:hypothetical protein
MKTTLNEKFVVYLTLLSGLALSGVAVYYSVSGLTAIFAAAVVPIIIMGVTLEVSKIVATIWLKQNWSIAPLSIKLYLCSAIALLMVITSMGIFGFLSKAHSDQNLVSGDVLAKIAVYDEKIKTEKENIEVNRKALQQMDQGIDQIMGRSTTEGGAEKAVAIRKSQQKERQRILGEITASQETIADLNNERAPIAAEVRKVEAEVGPLKYIAAFVYGSTDQSILERAVTWVIITIIIVFDPLALTLLLASQISFQNFKKRNDSGLVIDQHGTIIKFTETVKPKVDITACCQACGNKLTSVGTEGPICSNIHCEFSKPPQYEQEPTVAVTTASVPYQFIDESDGELEGYITTSTNTISKVKDDDRSVLQKIHDATSTKRDIESGYIQNEEQAQSNVWSTVNNISQNDYLQESQIRLENHINEIVDLIRSGQLKIDEVPQYIQKEVKAKL